ncbi:glycosyltransferase family 2 protein [Sorangium sp. So ce327]|jgi:glycosyltransferase involved in cell wall biosynthesis|uniref:glycosyltransferase family 2 protein n=1 Tax=unclassified Sorangium TaxID=2621164 RepID=UPI003F647CBA
MSDPRVSVIIPTCDRPQLVHRAVRSVLAQSSAAREIILVDDASSFDYVSALRALDPSIHVVRLERNAGPAVARNAGLRAATSELVAFLDDDDEFHPGYLARAAAALAEAPATVGLCWTGVLLKPSNSDDPRASRVRDFAPRIRDQRSLLLAFLSIGLGHGVTVRRECFAQVGGFSEDLRLVEDTEWFLRFLSHGYLPTVVPGVHVTVHCHEDPRLTSLEHDSARLHECGVVLERMAAVLDAHPYLRDKLRFAVGLSGQDPL